MLSRLKPLPALASSARAGSGGGGAPRGLVRCRRVIRLLSSAKPSPSPSPSPVASAADAAPSPEPPKQQQQQQPLLARKPPLQQPPPSSFPLADPAAATTSSSSSSNRQQQQQQQQLTQWLPVDRDAASPSVYLALAKSRLTLLIVTTAAAGYAMAPGQVDPAVLAACLLGTGLASASANAINQLLEAPYDAQMLRTRARPLVTGRVSPATAAAFAAASGTAGVGLLAAVANPVSAGLALANLLLYTAAYTPAKRLAVANTAIGALVGALPPLIGWSAATGGSLDLGAVLLGLLMFHWQFPHFHALSWALRDDYSRAGYCMASVLEPGRCRRSALLNSALFSAVCYCLPVCGLTSWAFLIDTLPFNAALLYFSGAFYWHGDSNSGRRLFRFSLFHLPIIFLLMLVSRTPDSERELRASQETAGLHHSFAFWRD